MPIQPLFSPGRRFKLLSLKLLNFLGKIKGVSTSKSTNGHSFSYHIGESMLPSINHFYEYIGAEEKLRGFGFAKKVGAAAKFKQNKREACKRQLFIRLQLVD